MKKKGCDFKNLYYFNCKSPPVGGGVLCWVVSKATTWRKRNPPEEQTPRLINFGGCFSGRILFLRVMDHSFFRFGNHPKKKIIRGETLPGGGFNTINSTKSCFDPDSKQTPETEVTFWYVLLDFVCSEPFPRKQKQNRFVPHT